MAKAKKQRNPNTEGKEGKFPSFARNIKKRSEYSPWGLEFERANKLLEILSRYYIEMTVNPRIVCLFLAALNELYRVPRTLMNKTYREKYDKGFRDMRKRTNDLMRQWAKQEEYGRGNMIAMPADFHEDLNEFYYSILDARQSVGMGVLTSPDYEKTKEQRIKGLFGGD